jgi:hypothetical protein
MLRLASAAVLLTVIACGGTSSEPGKTASLDDFAGSWSSVTPSYEFIRLSVVSKSVEQGAIGARLTLSGLALEGSARIDADSLIATMSAGSDGSNATLIAHSHGANTMVAQLRAGSGAPLELTLIRQ